MLHTIVTVAYQLRGTVAENANEFTLTRLSTPLKGFHRRYSYNGPLLCSDIARSRPIGLRDTSAL